MDVSVIVCTYNRSGSLRRTLEHIREMDVPSGIRWELLVVDNNSKDDTRAVVESFRDNTNIGCRYIFEGNQGLSFARNAGIENATGEIIVFTDDDVLVDASWIKNICDTFNAHGDVACIGGKILPFWEVPPPKWIQGELLNILALCDLGDEQVELTEVRVWGANLSFRSSVIRKYGLFDTKTGHRGGKLYGGEETKYLQVLIRGGEKVMYSPNVLVHHCIPDFRLTERYFRKWYFNKGELHAAQMGENNDRSVFGIPLVIFRRAAREAYYYLKTKIVNPDKSILSQMALVYNIGIIMGRLKYKYHDGEIY